MSRFSRHACEEMLVCDDAAKFDVGDHDSCGCFQLGTDGVRVFARGLGWRM